MRKLSVLWALPLLSALAATPTRAEPIRDFSVAGQQFTYADIVDARALPTVDGASVIMVTFSELAAKRVSALIKANVQKQLLITLDGVALAQPVRRDIVPDGVIQIQGSFDFGAAEAVAKRISGKAPLPDSLDEEE